MTVEGKEYYKLKLQGWNEKNNQWLKQTYFGFCITLGTSFIFISLYGIYLGFYFIILHRYWSLSSVDEFLLAFVTLTLGIFGIGIIFAGIIPLKYPQNRSRILLEAYAVLASFLQAPLRQYLNQENFPFTPEEVEKIWRSHHCDSSIEKYLIYSLLFIIWIFILYETLVTVNIVPSLF